MANNQTHSQSAAERIEAELEKLKEIASSSSAQLEASAGGPWRDFPGFWRKAREISDLFRSSELDYEGRIRLWKQHQDLCEQVSKLRQQERNIRRETSRANRHEVLSILSEARRSLSLSASTADFVRVRAVLDRALRLLKQSFFLRNDRHECWREWHDVDRALSSTRHDLSSARNKHRTRTDRALSEAIQLLSGMREQKGRIRGRLLSDIDSLNDDLKRSWKLEWAERAKTWIQEKRSKVEEVEREIDELDRQIKNLQGRVNI